MSWLFYFAVALVITGFAAVTGFKAKSTRHLSHTHLMNVARGALWIVAIVCVSLAIRAYATR